MIFMQERITAILCIICVFTAMSLASGESIMEPSSTVTTDTVTSPIELIRYENEFSNVHIEPALMGSKPGLAFMFNGTDDLHYYAKSESAPAPGLELKITAKSEDFEFGKVIFPKWKSIQDPSGKMVEVYAGRFTVFVPIRAVKDRLTISKTAASNVEVKISGIVCTSMVCLEPFEKTLQTTIDWSKRDSWENINIITTNDELYGAATRPSYSAWFALGLAFVAGLILNIMPCVLPVIPLKVLSIFEQAKQNKARCIAMGLSFCLGILLFFASLAALNIILRLGYGTVLQWGDHFRNPVFLVAMSLLMVLLALFMFGVFTVSVPSSIAGRAGGGKGHLGSIGMGFLAGILSTPCSFAILTAAFAWAQTQKLALATLAIMLIGAGMAAPYVILISMPSLLKYLPKAGRWTELFKQTMGFVLLIVAVWLITALPAARKDAVLYFGVISAFCVWMWGGWVSFSTPAAQKWIIRIIAAAIAIAAGLWLLPGPGAEQIDWQPYDAAVIEQAIEKQRPVLLEFMADWCLNCKTVEKLVYSRKDIAKLIEQKDALAIRADTTEKNFPATLALKNIYNEPGVPVSILFMPGKKEPIRWRGILFADELKKSLEKLPDSSRRRLTEPEQDRRNNGEKSEDQSQARTRPKS
jgi:thiol:disulfide interchange protein